MAIHFQNPFKPQAILDKAWEKPTVKKEGSPSLLKTENSNLKTSSRDVPLAVARKAFGEDPKPIIEELNEVLVA